MFGFSEKHSSPEEEAYLRLRTKGWAPAAIIDIGAYRGGWTRSVRKVFPDVPVLMVEAQEGKRAGLEAMCGGGVTFVSAVLGAESGKTVTFYEMETGSSYFPEASNAPRSSRTYTTRTLDELAGDLPSPLFLKIDVQGAELEVLAGGSETLSKAELVQLEVALLPYNDGAPTMLQVLTYMDERGFVPLDISGFSRPNGVDLVQIDIIFARKESSLRATHIEFEWFKTNDKK